MAVMIFFSIFCWLFVGTCRNKTCLFLISPVFFGCFNHSLRIHFLPSSSVFIAPLCFLPLPVHLPAVVSWVWKVNSWGAGWVLRGCWVDRPILSTSLCISLFPTPSHSFCLTFCDSFLLTLALFHSFFLWSFFLYLTSLIFLRKLKVFSKLEKAPFFAGVGWWVSSWIIYEVLHLAQSGELLWPGNEGTV